MWLAVGFTLYALVGLACVLSLIFSGYLKDRYDVGRRVDTSDYFEAGLLVIIVFLLWPCILLISAFIALGKIAITKHV